MTVVAVDIGNTSLHLRSCCGEAGRFGGGEVDAAADWVGGLRGPAGRSSQGPVRVFAASVCGPAEERLRTRLSAMGVTYRLIGFGDVPIGDGVDQIERVGVDRLLAAWRAGCLVGGGGDGESRPGDCVVIDSGSAITADLVRGGKFCGGVILPGLSMSSRALAGGTDRLFEVDFRSPDVAVPGRNTGDAIAGGILISVVAGLDRVIEIYRAEVGNVPVVGTGGDVQFLHHRLRADVRIEADLVCDAILNLPLVERSA